MSTTCAPCNQPALPCTPGPFPTIPSSPAFPAFPPPANLPPVDPGGTTDGGAAASACPAIVMPRLLSAFTAPALNAYGQLYSACAYLWCVPGCTLFFPPFGSVLVTGVSGDIITFTNLSIASGTTVQAQTLIIQGPPTTQQDTSIVTQPSLNKLRGFLAGNDAVIVGTANQVPRWNQSGAEVLLQNVSGMLFRFNPNWNTETLPKNVSGSSISTSPIPTSGTGLTAYYDLPNLPASNLLPATFLVRVHIRLSDSAAASSDAVGIRVNHGGVNIASLNSAYSNNNEVVLPASGTRLQLEYLKGNNRANCYARLRVIGYYF